MHKEPTPATNGSDRLNVSREEIDRLDAEFIRLLSERMSAVRDIGAIKGENPDAPLRDEDRERLLFQRWAEEAERRGMSGYFTGRILREILNYSRRDQERFLRRDPAGATRAQAVRIGYQGVPGSYSDLTISKIFATREVPGLERIGFRTFSEVVGALQSGELGYALLPIENTIAGSINEVYDLIAKHKVTIVGEEAWSVDHCLVGIPGSSLEQIRSVRSHPVALQQCQIFLDGLVGCVTESHHDTAGAAQAVAVENDPTVAAIASEEAAHMFGLTILRREISDQRENFTRFLLLAREPESIDIRQPSKTSLLFSITHRRGALLECLKALEENELNMTKLESRPMPNSPWEYMFYVDIEGAVGDERVDAALERLRASTSKFRILGSYPRRTGDESDLSETAFSKAVPRSADSRPDEPNGRVAPAPMVCATPKADPALRLCSLKEGAARTIVNVGGVEIGGDKFTLMLGPCAVESRDQIMAAAELVKKYGAHIMRGGAFKPRSSPYAFQGLGFAGLDLLAEAGRAYELPVVCEVLRPEDVQGVAAKAHMLQIGARNMQNFELLKELGKVDRPILLKRGMSATIKELLQAAEYVMAAGNHRVVLCERGIRTFETATRNTLDVSAVPSLKARTHLPVIVDPSHAAGIRELVVPLALAAAAVGADGLIIEAHPNPEEALCDKEQALTPVELQALLDGLDPIIRAKGKHL